MYMSMCVCNILYKYKVNKITSLFMTNFLENASDLKE